MTLEKNHSGVAPEVVEGDITEIPVDVIVNAANETLLAGGGVCGAIHSVAGPELAAECRTLGGCRTGSAVATGAYGLPAKYVIHAVGPVWQGGFSGEDELLANCYRSSIELARDLGATSISFPAISTGTFGFPAERAAAVATRTLLTEAAGAGLPEKTMLVCFSPQSADTFRRALTERIGGNG